MRQSLILSVLLISACSDALYRPVWVPDEEPVGTMYTISGIVVDSVSGTVIPGARVAVGKYVTDADAAGQWDLTVPGGLITVTASPAGYERTAFTFDLVTNAFVDLQARRLAPVVIECWREGDSVHALVVDLQGRKSLERWTQSEAYVTGPAGTYRVGADQWKYRAVDPLTWKVSLVPVAPEATMVRWTLYDSEGHRYSAVWEPVTSPAGG
jgi:hypothetical protein